jgi:hypothetical protein
MTRRRIYMHALVNSPHIYIYIYIYIYIEENKAMFFLSHFTISGQGGILFLAR